MSEKNRQLEIIENELQKVTTALNASQINESQRALSPETSIDSEYEALGGWKEMQDLKRAWRSTKPESIAYTVLEKICDK